MSRLTKGELLCPPLRAAFLSLVLARTSVCQVFRSLLLGFWWYEEALPGSGFLCISLVLDILRLFGGHAVLCHAGGLRVMASRLVDDCKPKLIVQKAQKSVCGP